MKYSIMRLSIMTYLLTAIMAGCISCAGFSTITVGPVDPAFDEFIDAYSEAKAKETNKAYTKNILMQFHSLGGSVIGVCYWFSDGSREIYIDPEFWFSPYTTNEDRELLIAHELGHCDLDRDHVDPSSIMEQYHIGGYTFNANKGYYYKELFDPSQRIELSMKPEHFRHKGKGCGGVVKEMEWKKQNKENY